ncbi:MAG: hypothetical protein HFE86_02885 [Clostridiales bacterium]|nr:hypothetical protein [Clostridiales bacterium]
MKKGLSLLLGVLLAATVWPAALPAHADLVQSDRYVFETESMDESDISYYAGATQDFYDYGNGVSGSYIRVENAAGVVGNYVEFVVDIPKAGTYNLSYVYRIHPTSGVNRLLVNGQEAGAPRDFNDRNYGNENDMAACTAENVRLEAGNNRLRIETVALSQSGKDRITVDYIALTSTDRKVIGYEEEVVFVSDMDYFDLRLRAEPDHIGMVFQSGGTLSFDQCTCQKQPILLGGVEYTKGFGLEPNDKTAALLDIPIPEGAESFKTVLGINDHKKNSSYDQQNVVTFYIDGEQVYETERLTFSRCETVELPLPWGAKTLTVRNNCGNSSENDHICFGDARFQIGTGSDVSLRDYQIEGGRVLADGKELYALMPEGSALTALAPTFTICQTSLCDKTSGAAGDFTRPATYTVTSANGQTADYTVSVFTQRDLTEEEAAAVDEVQARIARISRKASMTDRQAVQEAREAFAALGGWEKLHVSNYEALLSAEEAVEALLADPIRISCVGDSITWGGVAQKSYPVNLQEILGEDYRVYNGGVGGTTVSKNGNYPYWSTASYQRSKDFAPDYVLLMLGTNDAQAANWDNCKDKIEGYFRELIEQYASLECDPTIVLASPAWYYIDPSSVRYTAINVIISEMVERLAAEYGFTFVDISAVTENHPEWFARDGVHPDDAGYRAIAEAFAAVFDGHSDAALQSVELDGATLADYTQDAQGLALIDQAADVARLTFESGGRVETASQIQGPKTKLDITVFSPNGRYQNNYELTLISREGKGDLDLDGEITIQDVMETCKILARQAGGTEPAAEEHMLADIDEDSRVDVSDVMGICKILARKA